MYCSNLSIFSSLNYDSFLFLVSNFFKLVEFKLLLSILRSISLAAAAFAEPNALLTAEEACTAPAATTAPVCDAISWALTTAGPTVLLTVV